MSDHETLFASLTRIVPTATSGPWRNEGWDDTLGDRGWWINGGGPSGSMPERGVAVTFNLPTEDGETAEIRANADLIALAPEMAAAVLSLASDVRALLDYIGVDPDDDPDRMESFGAPSCVLSAVRNLR